MRDQCLEVICGVLAPFFIGGNLREVGEGVCHAGMLLQIPVSCVEMHVDKHVCIGSGLLEKVDLTVEVVKAIIFISEPGLTINRVGKSYRGGKTGAVNVEQPDARLVKIRDVIFRGTEGLHGEGIHDLAVHLQTQGIVVFYDFCFHKYPPRGKWSFRFSGHGSAV